MPLGYVVPALGRTGADLRAARGPHGLVATGPSARLGSLLPHLTTTTIQTADGRPLEVRLPFLLALWLVLGCLTITDDVANLCVYEFLVNADRLGAVLDELLKNYHDTETVTPSVLRRKLLLLAASLRTETPALFCVTAACLFVVGGDADNIEVGDLTPVQPVWPLSPPWFAHVTFGMLLSPDKTLIILAELECVWSPRFFPAQRSAHGGIIRFESILVNALDTNSAAIVNALNAMSKAEQLSTIAATLLPTAPEMVIYFPTAAAAALGLSRAFLRATSTDGALVVSVHEVLTVIPHFEPFLYAIGTELGAPAALGLLLELVRAALKSPTASPSIGNIAAAAEQYKYLVGRLKEKRSAHEPSADCVAFLIGELAERRMHEITSQAGVVP